MVYTLRPLARFLRRSGRRLAGLALLGMALHAIVALLLWCLEWLDGSNPFPFRAFVLPPARLLLPMLGLYAVLIACLITGYRASSDLFLYNRGVLRSKRRRCPACGYQTGRSTICCECGHDIRFTTDSRSHLAS
jgi:hypothetical protein